MEMDNNELLAGVTLNLRDGASDYINSPLLAVAAELGIEPMALRMAILKNAAGHRITLIRGMELLGGGTAKRVNPDTGEYGEPFSIRGD